MSYNDGNAVAFARKNQIKRPIGRGLLIAFLVMLVISSVIVFVLFRWHFSRSLYAQFNSKLTGAITYIENNTDADDLKQCLKTGVTSEKYDELQLFLNGMIDDLGFDYIYIVIPKEYTLVNAISATSAAEFAAGEDNIPLLEENEAYDPETLAKFASYWDAKEINFFEESSDYGTYYTAIKPLRDSGGETVALICVDLSSEWIHETVLKMVVIGLGFAAIAFILFGALLMLWLNKTVTSPLRALEKSTQEFVSTDAGNGELVYNAPVVKAQNEVGSLAGSIKKMTGDIHEYVSAVVEADKRANAAEREKEQLAEKAEAAAKIAALSESVSTLLNNMPLIAFYKDAKTGVYVACNQSFAEYAHKKSSEEVIGLTDFDMFDKATAESFLGRDKTALEMDVPYVFFEDVPNSDGSITRFRTTKLKFTDADGNLNILGMCADLTELSTIKRESEKVREAYEEAMSENVTYSRIARALSMDYAYLYYINIETNEFLEYHSDKSVEDIVLERRGNNFFEQSRKDAQTILHKDDRASFISAFNKENVLENIDRTGAFTFTYRQIIHGEPVYLNMKATRIQNDDKHIIIGVSNIDAQMKYQEAIDRIKEERTTYLRITALSGDFIAIYTVDPNTDHYTEYSATKDYEELGLAKEGDDFFGRSRENSKQAVFEEDLDMFLEMMTKEKVMSEINSHGLFVMNYRLMINGRPEYVALKAVIVQEKDGPQLIIGVNNIDAQVKREQEYAYNLSVAKSKANIDALTGVKNKHAYIDDEASINKKLEDAENVKFAIAVFDVNGLKMTNDMHGHRAGDELIRKACEMICTTFKGSPVYRIGGDEFVIIAQGRDYENVDTLISDIHKKNVDNSASGGVVVACGMSKYDGERNVAAVFEKADRAMYVNKHFLKSGNALPQ